MCRRKAGRRQEVTANTIGDRMGNVKFCNSSETRAIALDLGTVISKSF